MKQITALGRDLCLVQDVMATLTQNKKLFIKRITAFGRDLDWEA